MVKLALTITLVGVLSTLFFLEPVRHEQISALISLSALLVAIISAFKDEIFPFRIRVLLDEVLLAPTTGASHDSLALVVPLVFLNRGSGSGVVEGLTLKIEANGVVKIYTPVAEVDYVKLISERRALHADNLLGAFNPFVIDGKGTVKKHVLFTQEEQSSRYPFTPWTAGTYSFSLFVRSSRRRCPERLATVQHAVTDKILLNYKQRGGVSLCSSRELDV